MGVNATILRIDRRGILRLSKQLMREVDLKEGDEVIVEVKDNIKDNTLIIKPLKPKIVDIDMEIIEHLLQEE